MNVKKFNNPKSIGQQVVKDVENILKTNERPLICIAGGDTTIPIMEALVSAGKQNLDFSKTKFISLDEWGGLGRDTQGSCAQTLYDNLFTPLEISEDNIFFFDGTANLEEEAKKADEFIKSNQQIDYIVLGVGMNGHIGFNEPNVLEETGAMVVDLDSVTKKVMEKYFNEDYSLEQGITLSLNQIRQAKQIVVAITGDHKRSVYQKTIQFDDDPNFPVSLLKNEGEKFNLYVDSAAYVKE
ncbi:6-phosphogluconolactonase [Tetragenococcus halophilus]|uniref:6-phosphogluconolactonase n=1 Tax=Tetragenococcus halophilus TaxID=51669 RepID=UPI0010315DCF